MNDYIESVLGQELEIVRIVDYDGFCYVFYKPKSFSNPYKDERLNIISSHGPLKINKISKDYQFTNAYEFLNEFGDNKLFFPLDPIKPNLDNVIKNITLRKRINWDDFDLLLETNQIPSQMADMYSINKRDIIEMDVENEFVKDCIIYFLNLAGARYNTNNLHLEIHQNIE